MNSLNICGRWLLSALILWGVGQPVMARDTFGIQSINGAHIMSFHGSFSSAPPPFDGPPVKLEASQVGRLQFDGNGQAWGEYTLTFQTPEVPAGVRSRKSLFGTYFIDPDGHLVIEFDEYTIDPERRDDIRDNSVTIECYIVQAQQLARCVEHSLISYQQGPTPRPLPISMAGSLERQH